MYAQQTNEVGAKHAHVATKRRSVARAVTAWTHPCRSAYKAVYFRLAGARPNPTHIESIWFQYKSRLWISKSFKGSYFNRRALSPLSFRQTRNDISSRLFSIFVSFPNVLFAVSPHEFSRKMIASSLRLRRFSQIFLSIWSTNIMLIERICRKIRTRDWTHIW